MLDNVPEDIPLCCIHLYKLIKREFNTLSAQIKEANTKSENAEKSCGEINQRLTSMEEANKSLQEENEKLCEKLLDLDYQ